MKRTLFVFFLTWKLFLSAGVPESSDLPAQDKAKQSQEPLQHEVTVTVKLVQVYVVDSKGNPARDLEKSDFILYDNGKLQEITGFEKHFLSPPEIRLGETKPSPARDMPSLLNRKFIFIIDCAVNDLEAVAKSKQAVLKFLETQVQPGDELALFSFSGMRGLVLHEYLTADHQKVRAALQKALDVPGIAGGWDFGHPTVDGDGVGGPPVAPVATEDSGQRIAVSPTRVPGPDFPGGPGALSRQLQALAEAFRHIPGQKNIILFNRGFGSAVLRRGTHAHRIFTDMARELASANCPVYSVETQTERKAKERVFGDGSLEYLSKLTGGKYLSDVSYESRIAEDIQSATSNYYVLGYSIASTWDGKFHDIKVEVMRPGYKVHAQSGYFNPLPFNRLSPVEKHLHLLDLALGEKAYFEQHLNFPLIALPFSDQKPNTVLISEIPVQRIRETVGERTEFITLVFDQNKTIVEGQRVEFDWGKIGGEKVFQHATVFLAPGLHECRVIIRNIESGKAAVGGCSVEVPEQAAEVLRLYPPLLLVSGVGTQYLSVSGQGTDRTAKAASLPQIFPFPPKEYSPLIDGIEQGVGSFFAAVRCVWTAAQEPELEISAYLLPAGSEQEIPLPFSILSSLKQEGVIGLFLEIEVPELQPGRYQLRLRAEEEATKLSLHTGSEFSVNPPEPQKR